MKEGTMKELFEAAGYKDYKSMEIGKFYKPKNRLAIQTLEGGKVTKKEVTGLVYKGISKDSYKIITPSGSFLCTGEHAIFNSEKNEYEKVKVFKGTKALSINGPVEIKIEKVSDEFDILDLEVDGTHAYISEGILSHNTFGAGAKANGTVIKRMNYFVDTYKTPLLWISQERAAIEMMAHLPSVTGGYAVNFYPSTRFRVTPKDQITRSGEIVGITMKIKNYKNKTGIPFRECLLDVYFRDGEDFKSGIDGEGQYIDMLVELGEITQHGAWYYYHEGKEDMQRFQGMAGTRTWFKEHPEEFAKAKKVVNDLMAQHSALDSSTVEVDEDAEFQKEKEEQKAKMEANVADLAAQALAANEEQPTEEAPTEE